MSTDSATVTADRVDADEGVDTATPESDSTREGARAVSPKFRRIGTVLLAALAIAATATAAVLGWTLHEARAVENAARDAADVARQYAVTLTSVGAEDLEGDFAAVLDGATGEFATMYAESSEQLRQLLIDNQARAEGVVVDSGIKSASPTKVEVLLFIDQSVTNALVPEPRLDRSRVVMTMELVDGRWLASKVDLP